MPKTNTSKAIDGKLKIVDRKISELIPAEYNPRVLRDEDRLQIKKSLEKFDAVDPAIINMAEDRKNIIVGGNQRIRVASEDLGWSTFPCVHIVLTFDEEKELNVRLNKNVAQWDWDALMADFNPEDLLDWGFHKNEHLFLAIWATSEEKPKKGCRKPISRPKLSASAFRHWLKSRSRGGSIS